MADRDDEPRGQGQVMAAVLRALGTLLGVHVKHAKAEVKSDLGRIIRGVVLAVVAVVLAVIAVLLAHAAAVLCVKQLIEIYNWPLFVLESSLLGAVLIVAGADLLLAVLLFLTAKSKLSQPVLKETRALLKRTVTSLAEL